MKKITSILFVVFVILSMTEYSYSQWSFVGFIPAPVNFPSISVASGDVVWIATGGPNNPRVWRSTNGGVNWTMLPSPPPPEPFCVWAVDMNTGFVGDGGGPGGAGGNAKFYRTTNAGVSWTLLGQTGGSVGFFNGIVFSRSNPMFGIAQSDPPNTGGIYYIARTTDGGVSWTVTNPPATGSASAQNSVVCIDNLFYGFGLNSGATRVDITADGGTTWNVRTLVGAGTGGFVSGFAFSDDKMRGVAGTSGISTTISRTINGGVVWSSQSIGTGVSGYCNLKWIHGTNIVYLCGSIGVSGVVKRSTDGGITWVQQSTSAITGVGHFEYYKAPNNVIHLYAVAGDGSVIRYRDSSLVVGIEPINNNIPAEYRLEQNYPNPFNPVTTINFSLPKSSAVSIKVYDMIGNEVMTVVNEFKPAGNYSVDLDASLLSSGVYFYVMNTEDFKDSKKMILVK